MTRRRKAAPTLSNRGGGYSVLTRTATGLLFVVFPWLTTATITVTESGQRFPSRPDHLVGQKFADGFEYMARLQFIHSNLNLCPNEDNTIHVPTDGLPVALLAKSGGCSYEEKAKFASLNIQPQNNIVKYVIIYDDETRPILTGAEEQEGKPYYEQEELEENDDMMLELQNLSLSLSNQEEEEESKHSMVIPLSSSSSSSSPLSFSFLDQRYGDEMISPTTLGRRSKSHHPRGGARKKKGPDDSISVGVLLVSKHTGVELLRIISRDTYENRILGGPRIIVDGKNWRDRARSIMLWMGISLFSIACVCGCVLATQPNDFFGLQREATNQQPTRPTRRRLTLEEVEEHLPEIEFDDATQLLFGRMESKETNEGEEGDVDEGCEGSEEEQGQEHTTNTSALLNRSILEADCSICLDDYHPGEMLRSLPCGHTFHSDCITKWLTERSAVCPLCKAELVVVEEESDDEEEDDDGVDVESYGSGGDYVEMRDTSSSSDNDDDGTTPSPSPPITQTEPSRSSSWWRSLFPRRSRQPLSSFEETQQQQQSEPLLPSETTDEQQGDDQLLHEESQQQPLVEEQRSSNNVEETLV